MANRVTMVQGIQSVPPLLTTTATIGGLTLLLYFTLRRFVLPKRPRIVSNLPPVPVVPGVPVIGNLLQLKEKKPYKTFLKWAQSYGPIYSIKTGSSTLVVLNSTEVAKEAMVTRFSSISTRKLSKALTLLTANKCMVAMSDYDDFHKTTKRYILANVLGSNAQKRHRDHRDTLRENVVKRLRDHVEEHPDETVNFREIFESELFALALKQALGKNVKSIYVEELGCELSREEIFRVLVNDMMEGAIEVDWRDFFPYLKWIPNKSLENKLARMVSRRQAVMKALIDEQKKRIASGQELNCFIDYLLSEDKALTEEQISMLLWETIIETSDTTFITAEWAMYELAKNPELQDRLCREIESVFGSEKVSEDRLSQAPLLMAVFHETLRKYSPAPIIPLRYAHEDTQLGGYHIPAGTEIAINIYGCNMDEKQWESPEKWNPDRFFVNGKYEVSDLHKTMAFGAGKRVCAGSLQAMLIACTIVGTMVHDFVWKLKDAEEENVDTISLTTRKLYPLQPFISPRTTA